MPRGDIREITFSVKGNDGELYPLQFDDIYFTVKHDFYERNYIFQKRLSTGQIETDGEGNYWFVIKPEDTNGIRFGKYVFDIELVLLSEDIKQTTTGELVLTYEATHSANE